MGYQFSENVYTLKGCVNEILTHLSDVLVDYSQYGQELYAALRHEDDKEKVSIVVFLIRKNRGHYGFKPIDECHNPYYYNCPEKILKLSNDPAGLEWRTACRVQRAYSKVKKEIAESLSPGDEIETSHGTVKYVRKYGNSKTQFVGNLINSTEPSKDYRIPVKSITLEESVKKHILDMHIEG